MEIKTLNEQIERLRELIRKCYATVAGKNGTVPDVEERNMENLPAAIASTHDTLEELTITQNGEYLPQEGVDGFSKVVANVVPTKKVVIPDQMRVANYMLIDGYWAGELVDTRCVTSAQYMFPNDLREVDVSKWDTSKITNMSSMFGGTQIQNIDVSNWDTSKVTALNHIFNACQNLQYVDVSNWDTSSVTRVQNAFYRCSKLQMLDLVKWDMSNVTTCTLMLSNCSVMTSIIGYRTYDEVSSNNIGCLNGLKISLAIVNTNNLDHASLRALINGLADLIGQTAQTLTLGATLIAKLTEEDIAIAVNKNWTIV